MKNFISTSLTRGFLMTALLAGLLVQTSCVGVVTSLNQYSGEILYESAIESEGDLLSLVPSIQEDVQKHLKNEEQEQAFDEFQRAFMSRLIKDNAAFVDEFYDSMHSNDRQQINQALTDAGAIMEKELQKLVKDKNLTAENVVKAVLEKEGFNNPK